MIGPKMESYIVGMVDKNSRSSNYSNVRTVVACSDYDAMRKAESQYPGLRSVCIVKKES